MLLLLLLLPYTVLGFVLVEPGPFSWRGGAADACVSAAVRCGANAGAKVVLLVLHVSDCSAALFAVLCLVLDPPTHRLTWTRCGQTGERTRRMV